jgi:hypothetical protein
MQRQLTSREKRTGVVDVWTISGGQRRVRGRLRTSTSSVCDELGDDYVRALAAFGRALAAVWTSSGGTVDLPATGGDEGRRNGTRRGRSWRRAAVKERDGGGERQGSSSSDGTCGGGDTSVA